MNETFESNLGISTPVGQWVAQHPATSKVFYKHRIDFCCGGGKTLESVCRKLNIDAGEIIDELTSFLGQQNATDETDWNKTPLEDLIQNIVSTHHAYLRQELPRLESMARKVASVHGDKYPFLKQILNTFLELQAELVPHMHKEEQILFPAIRQLESSQRAQSFPFGSIGNPIQQMEHEHDNAGRALSRLRELTNDFQPPQDGCNTFRALYAGLKELESDMHQHVHKENNILFPRAAKTESSHN